MSHVTICLCSWEVLQLEPSTFMHGTPAGVVEAALQERAQLRYSAETVQEAAAATKVAAQRLRSLVNMASLAGGAARAVNRLQAGKGSTLGRDGGGGGVEISQGA